MGILGRLKGKKDIPNVWTFFTQDSDLPYRARYLWPCHRYLSLAEGPGTESVRVTHGNGVFTVELKGTLHDETTARLTRDFEADDIAAMDDKARATLAKLIHASYKAQPSEERDAARKVANSMSLRLPPF